MNGPASTAPLVQSGQIPRWYLDANVLLPEYLRAVFLELGDCELVDIHWGRQVLAEVRRNLLRPAFAQSEHSIDRLFEQMAKAFPNALVVGSEGLEALFSGKTDPKDAHVAAGALKLSRSVHPDRPVTLVTNNVRHLPSAAFAGTSVRPARPDAVLVELLSVEPRVAKVLSNMLSRFSAPLMSEAELLDILDRSTCSRFATALGAAWGFDAEP